ncbi:hypothetical protein BIFGAL_02982 [Bifidobacterium gallicum DSM 20093 = LMG 11596]|uniref:Uncharacterized protein n=1 Tax=Bifidobacterium gallicum DSM 20093 = LMG 11596 TaxID=561180 RepID=D1NT69_9BIFI|nr:hypothetical protein BIFGAL_02982 [Bifidobacterium gallicum DSM 20093 = LMG 11596]
MTPCNDDLHVDLPRLKRCYPLYMGRSEPPNDVLKHCNGQF